MLLVATLFRSRRATRRRAAPDTRPDRSQYRPEGVQRFEDRVLLDGTGCLCQCVPYTQFARPYSGTDIQSTPITLDAASHTASVTFTYTGNWFASVSLVLYGITAPLPVTPQNLSSQVLLGNATAILSPWQRSITLKVEVTPCDCGYQNLQFDAITGPVINLQTFCSTNGYGPYDQAIFASYITPASALCPTCDQSVGSCQGSQNGGSGNGCGENNNGPGCTPVGCNQGPTSPPPVGPCQGSPSPVGPCQGGPPPVGPTCPPPSNDCHSAPSPCGPLWWCGL